jgi:FkbM family methyltransferase
MYTNFHGETDGYGNQSLDAILRNKYFPDYDYKGVFIEIGSFDPILISNSYHFEKNGWDVYCFEANTQLIDRLKEERKNVYNYAVYDEDNPSVEFNVVLSSGWTAGFSAIEIDEKHIQNVAKSNHTEFPITKIKVEQKKLNTILENELKHITKIDVLALDVEGGELKCLMGLDFNKYRPYVILAENGGGCKPYVEDITEHLQNNGYVLDLSLSYNLFFVDSKK